MGLLTDLQALQAAKETLADNLSTMGQSSVYNESITTLVDKVLDIESGIDTSDADAIAGDILTGKTAYVNGVKLTGTLSPFAKTITNIKSNANFAGGTTGWADNAGNFAVVNGSGEIVATTATGGVSSNQTINLTNTRKYYCQAALKADTAGVARLIVVKNSSPYNARGYADNTITNQWEHVYFVFTEVADEGVYLQIQDIRSSGWTKIYIDEVILTDLTAIFGAGNEPTAEEYHDFLLHNFGAGAFYSSSEPAVFW